jgi:hypothetical protein
VLGRAKNRSRRRQEILQNEARCIYCLNEPTTVEHMPPTSMFKARIRLSGLEFAACKDCNEGTRAADAAASFFARISPQQFAPQWEQDEGYRLVGTLTQLAPIAVREIFDPNKNERIWTKGRDPIVTPKRSLKLDGPVTHALMTAFAAKLGMALFREHVGKPLDQGGSVFTQYYFNAGLQRSVAEATLSITPIPGQLIQGTKSSDRQFNYRYNCDNRSIIFAFAAFHDNLFVRACATNEPDTYRHVFEGEYNSSEIAVGGLKILSDAWNSSKESGEQTPPNK